MFGIFETEVAKATIKTVKDPGSLLILGGVGYLSQSLLRAARDNNVVLIGGALKAVDKGFNDVMAKAPKSKPK